MKCSFCRHSLLYIDKIERNIGQQMILYKCNDCNITYKKFTVHKKHL